MHFRTTVTDKVLKFKGSLSNNHMHWMRNEIDGFSGKVLDLRNDSLPMGEAPAGKLLCATMVAIGMNTETALTVIQGEMGVTRATVNVASSSDFGVRAQRVFLSNPPVKTKYGNLLFLGDFKYLSSEERLKPRGFRYSIALRDVEQDEETVLGFRVHALREGVANYVIKPRSEQWEMFNEALTFRLGKMPHRLLDGDLIGSEGKVVGSREVSSSSYSLDDLVLPVVGTGTVYPVNPSATAYRSAIDRLKLTAETMSTWKGHYRKALLKPSDIQWDIVRLSSAENPLMLSLPSKISHTGRKIKPRKETYLRLRFTLTEGDAKVVVQELLQRSYEDWTKSS